MRDFLVIGGGIAGISAAARLSELGQVTLLEAEDQLAYHASGRSAALFEPNYGLGPVVDLSRAGAGEFHHLGVLSPRGLMLLGGAEDGPAFAAERRALDLDEIAPDEACAMVPILARDRVARAAHAAHAWDIDTDLLIQTFLRGAKARGAEVRTRAQVTALTRTDEGWRAETPDGPIEARMVVNAAGAWADTIAALAGIVPVGLTPLRRSMARLPAPGGHDPATWPMLMGVQEAWYAKPDAGALIVSPSEEDPRTPGDTWPDDMVLAEGLARYEAMVTTPVNRLLTSWAGLRTFAPDRVLVIGPDPREPSFVWFAGQGGYGFQTAPAASRLLRDLIGGHGPDLPGTTVSALSPARFA